MRSRRKKISPRRHREHQDPQGRRSSSRGSNRRKARVLGHSQKNLRALCVSVVKSFLKLWLGNSLSSEIIGKHRHRSDVTRMTSSNDLQIAVTGYPFMSSVSSCPCFKAAAVHAAPIYLDRRREARPTDYRPKVISHGRAKLLLSVPP
jgi:hypothetical protein